MAISSKPTLARMVSRFTRQRGRAFQAIVSVINVALRQLWAQ